MTPTVKLICVHGLQPQKKRVSTSQLVKKRLVVFCSSYFKLHLLLVMRGSYAQRASPPCQVLYSLCSWRLLY